MKCSFVLVLLKALPYFMVTFIQRFLFLYWSLLKGPTQKKEEAIVLSLVIYSNCFLFVCEYGLFLHI